MLAWSSFSRAPTILSWSNRDTKGLLKNREIALKVLTNLRLEKKSEMKLLLPASISRRRQRFLQSQHMHDDLAVDAPYLDRFDVPSHRGD